MVQVLYPSDTGSSVSDRKPVGSVPALLASSVSRHVRSVIKWNPCISFMKNGKQCMPSSACVTTHSARVPVDQSCANRHIGEEEWRPVKYSTSHQVSVSLHPVTSCCSWCLTLQSGMELTRKESSLRTVRGDRRRYWGCQGAKVNYGTVSFAGLKLELQIRKSLANSGLVTLL